MRPYPNAFFDQIVLVALQLLFQPVRLDFHLLRRPLDPTEVSLGIGIARSDVAQALHGRLISSDIFASLRFGDGSLESFDAEIG